MNPIENMTLREIIRNRPLVIGILEEITGGSFWKSLDTVLEAFCKESRLDLPPLRNRIADLPANRTRQDWKELPLYFVVDHLTTDHRTFRSRDLPEIHRLLEGLRQDFPANGEDLDSLLAEYKGFRRDFSWHMEEEEEFIFPKILRTEASLRHPDLYPEVFKGSLRMYAQIQKHGPEEGFHDLVSGLTSKLRGMVSNVSQLPLIKDTLAALQGYEARLRAHTVIESEILFRRALAMEDSLLRRVA